MNDDFDFTNHSHKRFNPLTQSFVLCSPHRAKRPWLGQEETASCTLLLEHDENCVLCPRTKSLSGLMNPDYKSATVLLMDSPQLNGNCLHSLGSIETLR